MPPLTRLKLTPDVPSPDWVAAKGTRAERASVIAVVPIVAPFAWVEAQLSGAMETNFPGPESERIGILTIAFAYRLFTAQLHR